MKTPLLPALLLAAVLGFAPGSAPAGVVRPAPNFAWGPGKTLQSWRGQPVVLLIAPSPRSKAFRKQAARIQASYQDFAARNTVFVAAFTEPDGTSIPYSNRVASNVPFVLAANGAQIAASYGFNGEITVAVIGKDGNLDLNSGKIVPASQIMDMIYNNFEQQTAERKL
ncbi:MAG: redoxin domain-containing protein [Chthoniobacteraceae bacterium]|nr:redoxin domain-containing protein [Chthoniobacteraceae bacterium]